MTAYSELPGLDGTGTVKNVIVMIADGAGYNTLEAAREYLAQSGGTLAVDGNGFHAMADSTYALSTRTAPLAGAAGLAQDPNAVYDPTRNYDSDPVAGNTSAGYPRGFDGYEWNRATAPDSANTASAISTGGKSYNNAINVDGNGNALATLAELAHAQGKSVGIATTVEFSDATPAAMGGAHDVSRYNHADIALEMFSSGVLDVIAGVGNPDYDNDGALRATPNYDWMPQELWNQLKAGSFASADGTGWELLQSRADIQAAITAAPSDERLAMIAQAFNGTNEYRAGASTTELPYSVPRLDSTPTLTELSLAMLNKLDSNGNGFVATIEGGAVDRAMHSNDVGRMIEEYIDFNGAVKAVIDWVNSDASGATWDNTLLVITADHDHLLLGPDAATIPYQPVQPDADGDGVVEYQWFGNGHSNQLVPLFAYGADAEGVQGLADRVDSVFDADGNAVAGTGHLFTDEAELGGFLQQQLASSGTVSARDVAAALDGLSALYTGDLQTGGHALADAVATLVTQFAPQLTAAGFGEFLPLATADQLAQVEAEFLGSPQGIALRTAGFDVALEDIFGHQVAAADLQATADLLG